MRLSGNQVERSSKEHD